MELTKWLLVPLGFVLNDWCLIVSASPYRAKANVELNSIPTPRNSNKKGRYILFTICCDCPNATPLQENRIRYTVFTIMWRDESSGFQSRSGYYHQHANNLLFFSKTY